MKCKVCSYDHSEFDRVWVDRAMQGKVVELEAKLAIAVYALDAIVWSLKNDLGRGSLYMAEKTIAKINEVPE